jgi:hypothetical protein
MDHLAMVEIFDVNYKNPIRVIEIGLFFVSPRYRLQRLPKLQPEVSWPERSMHTN